MKANWQNKNKETMISDEMSKAVEAVFEKYGTIITTSAKEIMNQKNKNASGILSDSFSFDVKSDGNTVTLEISAEGYLKFLENGRSSGGNVNIASIIRWIQYKGIELRPVPGVKHGTMESRGVISKTGIKRGKVAVIRRNVKVSDERFAFAIATKIKKFGTTGTPIIKPIILEIQEWMNYHY
jgi:hypothetical protein